MKAKEIVVGGKKYLLSTNNNWELSNSDLSKPENQKELKALYPTLDLTNGGFTPAVIKMIQGLPRAGRSSNGHLRVKTDNAVVSLGMALLKLPEDGPLVDKGGSKFTEAFWKDIAKHRDLLEPETQKVVDAELATYQTKESLTAANAELLAEIERLKAQLGKKGK